MALLFLIAIACFAGAACGLLAALGIWLRLVFTLLDALVQQVPSGVMLFVRLATWCVVRLAKLARWLHINGKRCGLWCAQHAYLWLFVGSYLLREWYVTREVRERARGSR
ncbi:MAG TPA: hypothetical protein VN289_00605 [Paraburkholderia sp.]|nr:hypothetical protein [Paraburkholderia sp.]